MNYNSELCKYIQTHSDWRESLPRDYEIRISERPGTPLCLFLYDSLSNFELPIVQEARGIIINTEILEVCCWPFNKFHNYMHPLADEIDWNTARVEEKIDGSIIKLWYDLLENAWCFSTNGRIDAATAHVSGKEDMTFLDLIHLADNYDSIPFDKLDQDLTYMFELTSAYNRVLVRHEEAHLTHIGTRNNITGRELDIDIGMPKPEQRDIHDMYSCLAIVNMLNAACEGSLKYEGFVVVDAQHHRIKVKTPEYLMLAQLTAGTKTSRELLINGIRNGSFNVYRMSADYPEFAHIFKFYDYHIAQFRRDAKALCELSKWYYMAHDQNRKELASRMAKHKYASLAFRYLNYDGSVEELLDSLDPKEFRKFIPEYAGTEISKLFR